MKLKILNWEFEVVFERGFRNNVNGNNAIRNLGQISFEKQTIKLDSEDIELQETLMHEIIHAVSHFWSVGLEEKQTECLSVGLYCVLKENGDPRRRLDRELVGE